MNLASPLLRVPSRRLVARPGAWAPVALWSALAIVAAVLFARARVGATDALVGTYAAFVVPLIAFAVVGAALGGDGLARSTRPLVAFGASPARAALASVAVAVAVTVLVAAPLGAIVAVLAHGAHDPPIARDALVTAFVGALGGASYAALFAFGASFGARGAGRAIALGVDFVLGATDPLDLFTPRGHLRSLLGGDDVIDLSSSASAIALAILAIVFTMLAAARARRSPRA